MTPIQKWLAQYDPAEGKAAARDYKQGFAGRDAMIRDLRRFCFVDDTTYDKDHKRADMNEGRREVFLHLCNMLNVTEEDFKQKESHNDDSRDIGLNTASDTASHATGSSAGSDTADDSRSLT